MRKRYLFAVSIMLFFLGTLVMSNNTWASCPNLQQYQCTVAFSCGDEILSEWEDCVEICNYEDGSAILNGTYFACELGGRSLFSSEKTFVGWGTSWATDVGCFVNLRGRSMTIDLYYGEGAWCMDNLRCTPCDGCCF